MIREDLHYNIKLRYSAYFNPTRQIRTHSKDTRRNWVYIPHPLSMLKLFSYPHSVHLKSTILGPHPPPRLSLNSMDSCLHFGHTP